MPSRESERRSLEELHTLYELFPDTRDVLVEGRFDARLIEAYLRLYGCSAEVYDVDDRVNVDGADVLSIGADIGARGRLIFLAAQVAQWETSVADCVTCLIDADRGYLTRDVPTLDTLLVTDYGSMELYALSPTSLDKFFSVVLRVDPGSSIEDILQRMTPALVDIFVTRHVLHIREYGARLVEDFPSSCEFSGHPVRVDIRDALSRSLGSPTEKVLDGLVAEVAAVSSSILDKGDRRFVRGHDIAPMLIAMFGLGNDFAHADTVERCLMGCIEWADVHDEPMFVKLRQRAC